MSEPEKVWVGDSWRQADKKPRPDVRSSRANYQAKADRDYAEGQMTQEQWAALFELYSYMNADGSF